jgi:hypothetical protein
MRQSASLKVKVKVDPSSGDERAVHITPRNGHRQSGGEITGAVPGKCEALLCA